MATKTIYYGERGRLSWRLYMFDYALMLAMWGGINPPYGGNCSTFQTLVLQGYKRLPAGNFDDMNEEKSLFLSKSGELK